MSRQDYSALERAIHRLAFSNRALQLTAADIERALFGRRYRHIRVEKPVFITSLPRAGTTLLLEILSGAPDFATHCYRDMPFVLAPILWDTLSRRHRREAVPKERAHGDGMSVSYDSPEAFEEVLWQSFWPEKFKRDAVALWSAQEQRREFERFFREHIQKVIAVRSGDGNRRQRYVSKNNANVARLGLLERLFPDGSIVVPFRKPEDQARSLLRQHSRFSALHGRDAFSKRYMRDIGHLEFGELHRPIEFAGMDEVMERFDPATLDYWMGYWLVAFNKIIGDKDRLVLVSYERLCRGGEAGLRTLGERLEVRDASVLETAASLLRPPRRYDAADAVPDRHLLERAHALHDRLLEASIV